MLLHQSAAFHIRWIYGKFSPYVLNTLVGKAYGSNVWHSTYKQKKQMKNDPSEWQIF